MPNSETCDYCHKRLPANTGRLCDECFVPESPKGIHGKGFLLCLELLETNHVRLRFGQPGQEVIEPLVDVVNVEGGDFHQVPFRGSSSLSRGF